MNQLLIGALVCLMACLVIEVAAFKPTSRLFARGSALFSSTECWRAAKPVHSKFDVTRATEEEISSMNVKEWPTWTTEGSAKYKVGEKAPVKVYDTNELSYIISGSMEIYDTETGVATLVQPGDFVTFPLDYSCQWKVIETITKHWFCYKDDGSPDLD